MQIRSTSSGQPHSRRGSVRGSTSFDIGRAARAPLANTSLAGGDRGSHPAVGGAVRGAAHRAGLGSRARSQGWPRMARAALRGRQLAVGASRTRRVRHIQRGGGERGPRTATRARADLSEPRRAREHPRGASGVDPSLRRCSVAGRLGSRAGTAPQAGLAGGSLLRRRLAEHAQRHQPFRVVAGSRQHRRSHPTGAVIAAPGSPG